MSEVPKFVRQRAARQQPDEHPEANLLSAFAEGRLTQGERAQVLNHLAACTSCREIVSLALPEAQDAIATNPVAKSWFRWPVLRWVGAAAAVIVVAAAVVVERSDRSIAAPAVVPAEQMAKPAEQKQAETGAAVSKPLLDNLRTQSKPGSSGAPVSAGSPSKVGLAGAPVSAKAKTARDEEGKRETRADALKKDAPRNESREVAAVADEVAEPQSQAKSGVAGSAPAAAPAPAPPVAGGAPAGQMAVQGERQAFKAQGQGQSVNGAVGGAVQSQSAAAGKLNQRAPAATAESVQLTEAAPARRRAEVSPLSNAVLSSSGARWRVSSEGKLERSTDAGRSWQLMRVAAAPGSFRTVSSVDGNVWVGGTGGALYHSVDGGRTWKRVPVIAADMALAADIARVEFTDAQHGSVSTTTGEIWTTTDGGATWSIQPR